MYIFNTGLSGLHYIQDIEKLDDDTDDKDNVRFLNQMGQL